MGRRCRKMGEKSYTSPTWFCSAIWNFHSPYLSQFSRLNDQEWRSRKNERGFAKRLSLPSKYGSLSDIMQSSKGVQPGPESGFIQKLLVWRLRTPNDKCIGHWQVGGFALVRARSPIHFTMDRENSRQIADPIRYFRTPTFSLYTKRKREGRNAPMRKRANEQD